MQTKLAGFIRDTPQGEEARDILGRCVHCGFCTATCPTYQLLGDELDGPRGRIYLIKQVLEGVEPTTRTRLHLDRCLTCRACETTCPSGVEYGRLLDIGRKIVSDKVPRPAGERILRAVLKEGVTGALFPLALGLGRAVRPLLPTALREQVPPRQGVGRRPGRAHPRTVVLLEGCVQPAMYPNIDAATVRVLDATGIEAVTSPGGGCCGAIRHHLDDHAGALADARRNIDAWWPAIEAGAEAVVMNASGCGSMVKEYGHLLRYDPAYAERAARIGGMTRDLAELIPALLPELEGKLQRANGKRIVFHPPCSLQHGQRIRGAVEGLLAALGAEVLPFAESHLCCGSAGTYSILQPELSRRLRARKLQALAVPDPEVILSANIGCIAHLGAVAPIPVRHWIEWLDERL